MSNLETKLIYGDQFQELTAVELEAYSGFLVLVEVHKFHGT